MQRLCSRTLWTLRYGRYGSLQVSNFNPPPQLQYGTFKDKLLKVLPFQRRNADKALYKNVGISQQVTPVIVEMVRKANSLNDMLYITEKILPKVTFADKVIILNKLTERLYDDVVNSSDIFGKSSLHRDTHIRLCYEGTLSKTVKPLTHSPTVAVLIREIIEGSEHLKVRQILDVFYNLQLLDWPRERREMAVMHDKVHQLQFTTLTLEELLLYLHALNIYMPALYRQRAGVFMWKWFEKNEFSLESNYIYEALDMVAYHYALNSSSLDPNIWRNIVSKLKCQVNISGLGIDDLFYVHNILCVTLYHQKENPEEAEIRGFKLSVRDQIGRRLTNLSVNDLILWNKGYINKMLPLEMKVFQPKIYQKYMELLTEGQLKCDAELRLIAVLGRTSFMKDLSSTDKSQLKERLKMCLIKTDMKGLITLKGYTSIVAQLDLSDLLQQRIVDYARSDLFKRDILLGIKMLSKCCEILVELSRQYGHNRRNMMQVIFVRDKLMECYRDRVVFDDKLQAILLHMLIEFPRMTPTSLEFLENVNHFPSNMQLSRKFLHFKEKALEDGRLKHLLTCAGYSRCNTAWAMQCSRLVRVIIHDFQKTSSWEPKLQDVQKSSKRHPKSRQTVPINSLLTDPILHILNDKLLEEICEMDTTLLSEKEVSMFYKLYRSKPEALLKILQQHQDEYMLLKDAFLQGCLTDTMKKLADSSHQRKGPRKPTSDLERTRASKFQPSLLHYVKLPPAVKKCVERAFKGKVEHDVFWNDTLYVDTMVHTKEKSKKTEPSRVAVFYRISNKMDVDHEKEFIKSRLIKDLQKSGMNCVVIWDQEWNSIANRTAQEKIRLIQTKVSQNSLENTASAWSYDLERVKQGPYKEFFIN